MMDDFRHTGSNVYYKYSHNKLFSCHNGKDASVACENLNSLDTKATQIQMKYESLRIDYRELQNKYELLQKEYDDLIAMRKLNRRQLEVSNKRLAESNTEYLRMITELNEEKLKKESEILSELLEDVKDEILNRRRLKTNPR